MMLHLLTLPPMRYAPPANRAGGVCYVAIEAKTAYKSRSQGSYNLSADTTPQALISGVVSSEAVRLYIAPCPHHNSPFGMLQIMICLKQQTLFKRPVYLELTF